MCITLLSTAHPAFPFILLSNRDEFLNRPTAPAHWWDAPNEHVLGGRDLQRSARGTWLGITKDGRIANLTNFRDEGEEVARNKSRGGLVTAYLATPPVSEWNDETFVKYLVDDLGIHNVGGFTLLFGELRASKEGSLPGLAAVSNRTSSAQGVRKIATKLGETHGLSNSHFGDATWPKVVHGEQLLQKAIAANVDRDEPEEKFIDSLFDVLSVDTLPRPKEDESFQTYTKQLRNSIMIPPVGGQGIISKPADKVAAADGTDTPDNGEVKVGDGIYGTQKQTVILVNTEGHVTFVERTLYDGRAQPPPADQQTTRVEFDIEGWHR
ncbi:hypothetical protein LTR36_000730 [Oleoguttula mirabilis]|uniref:DUF833-domain-containing protein n=1 Tax=Oleoguttula mirabilis TaxID=1507867 RepID=A0AAV9JQS7_9PEZI|nr:hypothetical protein LTR36_000730 [Oleoguttula mirabilis]